jgi:hypothetical protein
LRLATPLIEKYAIDVKIPEPPPPDVAEQKLLPAEITGKLFGDDPDEGLNEKAEEVI